MLEEPVPLTTSISTDLARCTGMYTNISGKRFIWYKNESQPLDQTLQQANPPKLCTVYPAIAWV